MILGIIPARGGSKGIAGKNIRPVAGKPLIAWTIEAARLAHRLDRFVVSTEDNRIARVAQEYGAEVLPRPADLAEDGTSTLAVLQSVLEAIPADVVVVLQPTSPVREDGLIDRCIAQFLESGADSLATGFMSKHIEYGKSQLRRQDIEGFFCDDGNVYVIRGDLVAAGDRYGVKIERMLIGREQNVDIDEEFDLWLAERILRRRSATSE